MKYEKGNRVHRFLYLLIIVAMILPALQLQFEIFDLKPLKGAIKKKVKPTFSDSTWYAGSYQDSLANYIDDNAGFRSTLIRLNNQLYYSLYDEARASQMLIGKEGYLYEVNYIKAVKGIDFVGRDAIQKKVEKLKAIKAKLKKKGIDLLVVMAPGKGDYFPEYLPEEYDDSVATITNYEVYMEQFEKQGINIFDVNGWFMQQKDSSPYPLYPKNGIHWSKYGEYLAVDSMFRQIERLRNISMPDLVLKEIKEEIHKGDQDAENGMNLLFDIEDLNMGLPVYTAKAKAGDTKPKAIVISDSFWWGTFNWGVSKKMFTNGKFWYYNKQIFPDHYKKKTLVKNQNLSKTLKKQEVVIIICTTANLPKFGYGFIDSAYDEIVLNKNYDKKLKAETAALKKQIKRSEKWMKSIRKKAAVRNISVKKMIEMDALFQAKLNLKKEKF